MATQPRWSAALARLLAAVEPRFDAAKARLWRASDARRRVTVVPYRGYGTRERIWVKGRVLLEPALPAATRADPAWRNLVAALRRFESDEVPGARLRLAAGGSEVEVVADEEGYFESWVALREAPAPSAHSVPVRCTLLAPQPVGEVVESQGEAVLPPPGARLAVVSDVDDTVVPTGAGKLLRMARNVLLHNAHTRAPFPGVAALYRALAAGRGAEGNPFLYVSSGPWNLYDLLVAAFRLHELPPGPLVLRDWGVTAAEVLPTDHHGHKLAAIRQTMAAWPHLPFLLVGDSGQQDPEIYRRVAGEQRGRVLGIYIRDVSEAAARRAAIAALGREAEELGSPLLLAPTAWELAQDAHGRGWIGADALSAVAAGVGKDGVPPAAGPAGGPAAAG